MIKMRVLATAVAVAAPACSGIRQRIDFVPEQQENTQSVRSWQQYVSRGDVPVPLRHVMDWHAGDLPFFLVLSYTGMACVVDSRTFYRLQRGQRLACDWKPMRG